MKQITLKLSPPQHAKRARAAVHRARAELTLAIENHLKALKRVRPQTGDIIQTIELQIDDLTHVHDYLEEVVKEFESKGGAR